MAAFTQLEKLNWTGKKVMAVMTNGGSNFVVYMTTDISPGGLMAGYEALEWTPEGNVAVQIFKALICFSG